MAGEVVTVLLVLLLFPEHKEYEALKNKEEKRCTLKTVSIIPKTGESFQSQGQDSYILKHLYCVYAIFPLYCNIPKTPFLSPAPSSFKNSKIMYEYIIMSYLALPEHKALDGLKMFAVYVIYAQNCENANSFLT